MLGGVIGREDGWRRERAGNGSVRIETCSRAWLLRRERRGERIRHLYRFRCCRLLGLSWPRLRRSCCGRLHLRVLGCELVLGRVVGRLRRRGDVWLVSWVWEPTPVRKVLAYWEES